MRWIPSSTFLMGSEDFYPEERPVHRVAVDGFWIDERPVTGGEFRRFVRDTDYVSFCERPLDPADYPGADPELLVPGSLVFRKTAGPVDLRDLRNWCEYVPGASALAPPYGQHLLECDFGEKRDRVRAVVWCSHRTEPTAGSEVADDAVRAA